MWTCLPPGLRGTSAHVDACGGGAHPGRHAVPGGWVWPGPTGTRIRDGGRPASLGRYNSEVRAIADGLADVRGSSYRSAAERGARLALGVSMAPSLEDVLSRWDGPDHDGEDDLPGHAHR